MVQLVKYLLGKYEDRSSDPQHPSKKQDMAEPVTSALERQGQEELADQTVNIKTGSHRMGKLTSGVQDSGLSLTVVFHNGKIRVILTFFVLLEEYLRLNNF